MSNTRKQAMDAMLDAASHDIADTMKEQGIEDRVVQCLHRALFGVHVARAAEAARQQQVGQLRHEILQVDVVQQVAGELGVAVFHQASEFGRWPIGGGR